MWNAAQASGARLIRVESMRRAVNPFQDWRAFHELVGAMRSLSPDIVHTHSSKAGILGRAAAGQAGVPVIVHTIHGMSFNRTQSWPVRMAYRALENEVAGRTNMFVAVANAMIEQAVAAGLAPRDRFVMVRSGLEVNQFAPNAQSRERVRAEWGVGVDDIVVGTVARLFKNKGYEDIIAAMPAVVTQNPKVRFVWVGDGAQRNAFENSIARLGCVNKVHIVGLVPPAEVARLMCGFDLLVHASRWEGLPRAVVQALLTEIPCVSYDNDGAPEVVRQAQTGILVHTGDIDGLSEGILRLAADPALRRRLGVNGRTLFLSEFDWRVMIDKLDGLYSSLTGRRE